MLPSEHRLRLEKDIKTLFAKGKSVFGLFIGMKYRPNQRDVSRFAVVAGVKVSKKAVDRNRIKRQVRAIVHELLPEIKPGYDVLLFAKKETLGKTSEELRHQLMKSFKKAGLL